MENDGMKLRHAQRNQKTRLTDYMDANAFALNIILAIVILARILMER